MSAKTITLDLQDPGKTRFKGGSGAPFPDGIAMKNRLIAEKNKILKPGTNRSN